MLSMCDWQNCPLNPVFEEKFKSINQKLDDAQAFNAQHFELNELAIKKAEDSMTMRLDNMNEFRAQLSEERGSLATKEQVLSVSDSLDKRIKQIELTHAEAKGKASIEELQKVAVSVSSAKLIAIIGTALAIIAALVEVIGRILPK